MAFNFETVPKSSKEWEAVSNFRQSDKTNINKMLLVNVEAMRFIWFLPSTLKLRIVFVFAKVLPF